MTLSAWTLLVLAVPVLLVGEWLHRRFAFLPRFNIPVPVVGGLAVAALVLVLNLTGVASFSFGTKVTTPTWTWLVTPEHEWLRHPAKNLNLPLLVGFFTCVGLGAPVSLLRTGGRALVILLGGATLLAVIQSTVGVAMAAMLHAPPLLGVICGALTLVGGHGTALGFATRFEQAGFPAAATVGAAAATFGLVAGGLLAGPLAEWLLRRHGQRSSSASPAAAMTAAKFAASFFADLRSLRDCGASAVGHLLLVAACIKAGAWASFGLDRIGAPLPAYMGALLVGLALRAIHDAVGARWLRPDAIARIAAVLLPLFLAVTLSSLNLADLATVAGPMFIILAVNTLVTLAFAALIAWPLLGRDHEAGVMTAGLVGFCVGSTATAVAAMDAIVRRRGPAPRAFAVVPPTGGFLIDLTNAPVITAFINFLR